jgi:DNA-binding transcriptional regulator WhiA
MVITEKFVRKMIQDYREGDSLRTIGKRYGMSHETVSKYLTAWGEPVRKPGDWKKLPDEQITAICRSYKGETLEELAKRYDVCPSTISRIFKSNNIEPVKRRQYAIDPEAFDSLNIHSIYWLGYLYSRAFIRSKYHFEVRVPNDRFHAIHINKLRTFLSTRKEYYQTKTQIRFRVTCKELVDRLVELGVRPIVHLRYPKAYIQNPLAHAAFIRGYFDGRGSATRIVGGYDLDIVSNPQFLNEVRKILMSRTGIEGQKIDSRRLRYSKEDARAIAHLLAMTRSKTAKTLPHSDPITRILKYHKRKRV